MPDVTSGKMFRPQDVSLTQTSGPYLQSEAVRSTGSGPFDAAYRQNLASYGGFNAARPGGSLSFNPTDPTSFPGQASGFGSAPLPGAPVGLLDFGLAGMGFTTPQSQQPQSSQDTSQVSNPNNSWSFWLNNFSDQGSLLRNNLT